MSSKIKNSEGTEKTRIEYLEKTAKWNMFCFDLLSSLGERHHDAGMKGSPAKLFEITRQHIQQIIDFEVSAFYLVDEADSGFYLCVVDPENQRDIVEKEVNDAIEDGTFAWAVNQNAPVLVKSQALGKTLVFHALATKRRVRGMFVGILNSGLSSLEGALKHPLSIILQFSANMLESTELYHLMKETNSNLELKIRERTNELEKNLSKLKEEFSYRNMVEEALWIAKEEAESASQTKNKFLANISHEFRTPLNAILGFAEILQVEAQKNNQPDFVEDLQAIESAGKHLLNLINDILDFVKIQSGKVNYNVESFQISKLLREVTTTLGPLARKNGNTLILEEPHDLGLMKSDVNRVRQILLNLLGNACKFTSKGSIRLSAKFADKENPTSIVFNISDTGIGMDPRQIEKLFQEFAQGEHSENHRYEGTGLGLPISRHLCRGLGGDIEVVGELGKGTTFKVHLPLQISTENKLLKRLENSEIPDKPEWTSAQPSPTASLARVVTQPSDVAVDSGEDSLLKKTVLIIDDDSSVCDLIQQFANREGFRAEMAFNGDDGIRLARKLIPEIIFIDVVLSDVEGWEVVQALKDDAKLKNVPIVIISHIPEDGKSQAMGVSDYLRKPLNSDMLTGALKKVNAPQIHSSILIVEDDPTIREALSRILQQEGWRVGAVSDRKSALEYIGKDKPGLMILDISLDEKEGYDLLFEIKKNKDWSAIPIIIFTAKSISQEGYDVLDGTVQKILQKGNCTRAELFNQIRTLTAS